MACMEDLAAMNLGPITDCDRAGLKDILTMNPGPIRDRLLCGLVVEFQRSARRSIVCRSSGSPLGHTFRVGTVAGPTRSTSRPGDGRR